MKNFYCIAVFLCVFCIILPTNAKGFSIRENNFINETQEAADYNQTFSRYEDLEWDSCNNIRNGRNFEVCNQKKSTDAAIESAKILYWQAWISLLTLLAAVAAAIFSGLTIRQSGKGVSIALKVGSAELRPHIQLKIHVKENNDGIIVDGSKVLFDIEYKISNRGKSAFLLGDSNFMSKTLSSEIGNIDYDYRSEGSTHKEEEEFFNRLFGDNYYLHPGDGDDDGVSIIVQLTEKEIIDLINDKQDLITHMTVGYNDNIGNVYEASYAERVRFFRDIEKETSYKVLKKTAIKLQQEKIVKRATFGFWQI